MGQYTPNNGKENFFTTGSVSKDLTPFGKGKQQKLKKMFGLNKPKMPEPTEAEKDLQDRQALQLLELDQQENRRIKSIFRAGAGAGRIFRGTSGADAAKTTSGASASGATAASSSAARSRPMMERAFSGGMVN